MSLSILNHMLFQGAEISGSQLNMPETGTADGQFQMLFGTLKSAEPSAAAFNVTYPGVFADLSKSPSLHMFSGEKAVDISRLLSDMSVSTEEVEGDEISNDLADAETLPEDMASNGDGEGQETAEADTEKPRGMKKTAQVSEDSPGNGVKQNSPIPANTAKEIRITQHTVKTGKNSSTDKAVQDILKANETKASDISNSFGATRTDDAPRENSDDADIAQDSKNKTHIKKQVEQAENKNAAPITEMSDPKVMDHDMALEKNKELETISLLAGMGGKNVDKGGHESPEGAEASGSLPQENKDAGKSPDTADKGPRAGQKGLAVSQNNPLQPVMSKGSGAIDPSTDAPAVPGASDSTSGAKGKNKVFRNTRVPHAGAVNGVEDDKPVSAAPETILNDTEKKQAKNISEPSPERSKKNKSTRSMRMAETVKSMVHRLKPEHAEKREAFFAAGNTGTPVDGIVTPVPSSGSESFNAAKAGDEKPKTDVRQQAIPIPMTPGEKYQGTMAALSRKSGPETKAAPFLSDVMPGGGDNADTESAPTVADGIPEGHNIGEAKVTSFLSDVMSGGGENAETESASTVADAIPEGHNQGETKAAPFLSDVMPGGGENAETESTPTVADAMRRGHNIGEIKAATTASVSKPSDKAETKAAPVTDESVSETEEVKLNQAIQGLPKNETGPTEAADRQVPGSFSVPVSNAQSDAANRPDNGNVAEPVADAHAADTAFGKRASVETVTASASQSTQAAANDRIVPDDAAAEKPIIQKMTDRADTLPEEPAAREMERETVVRQELSENIRQTASMTNENRSSSSGSVEQAHMAAGMATAVRESIQTGEKSQNGSGPANTDTHEINSDAVKAVDAAPLEDEGAKHHPGNGSDTPRERMTGNPDSRPEKMTANSLFASSADAATAAADDTTESDSNDIKPLKDLAEKMEKADVTHISARTQNVEKPAETSTTGQMTAHDTDATGPFRMTHDTATAANTRDAASTQSLNSGRETAGVSEKSVMDQIISKASLAMESGRSELKVDIKPESLGAVKIHVVSENHQMIARIMTETHQAKEIIQHHIDQLRLDLNKGGLQVDAVDVSVDDGGSNAGQSQPGEGEARQARQPFTFRPRGYQPGNSNDQRRRQQGRQTRDTGVDYYA